MKKPNGLNKSIPNFMDKANSHGIFMIKGKTYPYFLLEYLEEHRDEKMYIEDGFNNVQKIYAKAVKWNKKRQEEEKDT